MRRLGLVLVAAVAAGLVGALAWSQLAQPGLWEVRDTGIVMTEEASQGQFAVVVLFVVVGVVISLVWSIAASVLLRGIGWPLVVVAVVGAGIAAVVTWRLGVLLGPPDPTTVAGLRVGDTLPDRLRVDDVASFVTWPMAALVGVLLTTWGPGRGSGQDREIDATTAPVVDTRS